MRPSRWIPALVLLAFSGCYTRSTVGEPFYCKCAVPLLGRGGCSGYGIPFDSWACVPPGAAPDVICGQACMAVAGIGSGSWLECVDFGTGHPTEVAALRPDPSVGSCTASTSGPLLATTGYESQRWDYVPSRSMVHVANARDSKTVPISEGSISLYMPEGHTNPGPVRFDMLHLRSPAGVSAGFTFDGHTIKDFRVVNQGVFAGTAGPGHVSPPRPGQFNSYRIESGVELGYALLFDSIDVSDIAANTTAVTGYMYRDAATGDSYLVYEGSFTIGADPKQPVTLTMHLEFRYGVSGRPPPTLDIGTRDPGDGTVEFTAVPGDKDDTSTKPPTYTYLWVAGLDFGPNAPTLSNKAKLTIERKAATSDWYSVLVYANEARVWRQARIKLPPPPKPKP